MTPSIILTIVSLVIIVAITIAKPNPLERPQILTKLVNFTVLPLLGGIIWTFFTNPWYIGVTVLVGTLIVTAITEKIADEDGKMMQTMIGDDKRTGKQ